jgi:general secretion pathway protein G
MRFRTRRTGFTLLELMMAIAVVGLLAAVAVPSYQGHLERLKIGQARNDLLSLANSLERYRTNHNFQFPDSLADVPDVPAADPWGNPYEYLNFAAPIKGIKGMIRKDHNLHPLNSEFDLYSKGADGRSAAPLTAKASHDDVIWARDGAFIGLASDF